MLEYDNFHKAIDQLIKINMENRKALKDVIKHGPVSVIARMFYTVKCNIGRRTGNSEYIRRNADSNSVIIVNKCEIAKAIFGDVECDVFSARQLKNGVARGKIRYNKIFVDESSYVFNIISQDALYKELASEDESQLFVMLGD